MKLTKFASIGISVFLAASASILSAHTRALGAEKVVLTFGPLRQSINVSDLEDFAKDGTTTPTIRQIIGVSKMDAGTLRGLIGLEVGLKPTNLARILYSTPGEKIVNEIGEVIRTQRNTENGKALRAAVILAASDDGKLSLLEILQRYPLAEMYVDVAQIGAAVAKVQGLAGNMQTLLQDSMRSTTTTETTTTETTVEPRRSVQPTTPPPPRPVIAPAPARIPQPARPVRGLW
ncbi:MAG: alpha/beta hydrolase [Tychonema bourrellyi B0820]|uniref:Alpha/beta hydrolase n=1 Tax=Tychonema bourrellyi FEM_GT703 TaxID=2040638 RepID=A0A2G4EZF1_9CYAN|nr:alpha/beta hydrolase [Tychonema bourrellyi]MDQ2100750.1 alpha/beta hydrolase [Tychonema bourrellyi B0820]PHX54891.1 alpha/beta hydrolase [Tychonema bourrellyi FEM_GT703]